MKFRSAAFLLTLLALSAPAAAQCETQKIFASDGIARDFFGKAAHIDGNRAVIGAFATENGIPSNGNPGSVYVFEMQGTGWVQTAKLLAGDGNTDDEFGNSVAVSGDYVLTGAEFNDNANGSNAGAAYVFEYDGANWNLAAKLMASDGQGSDHFGEDIGLSGNVAIIGARDASPLGNNSGTAYVFERIGGVWTETAKLLASDGAKNDLYGDDVYADGGTIVVGSWRSDAVGGNAGAAYVYQDLGAGWVQVQQLVAGDAAGGEFGRSVCVDGDRILVGAWKDSSGGAEAGSAYLFELQGAAWVQVAKLIASDIAPRDHFGFKCSLSGDTAVVGSALADPNGFNSGAAYVFQWQGASWVETAKLVASDGTANDEFAHSVTLSGDTAILGAVYSRGLAGSAYVFSISCSLPPAADFTGAPRTGAAPLLVQYADTSQGTVDSWGWNFGDGGASTVQNPAHVYATPGSYTVALDVDGAEGPSTVIKSDYTVVGHAAAGLADPGSEGQAPGGAPSDPWTVLAGTAHRIRSRTGGIDNGFPSAGAQWLALGTQGTDNAQPPSNPGGVTAPSCGGAGVGQAFTWPPGQPTLRFDAAFVRNGNANDFSFNDWMSVDVSDGATTYNLYYADTFTPTPNVSTLTGLPMTALENVSVDLALAFPGADSTTVFTLTCLVGNGGDDQLDSKGYVDNFQLGGGASATVRNGTGVNDLCYDNVTLPILGQLLTSTVDATNHPGAGLTFVYGYRQPTTITIALGELLILTENFGGSRIFRTSVNSLGGVATHSLLIPNNPIFIGLEIYTQAVIYGGQTELCNAIDLVVGL